MFILFHVRQLQSKKTDRFQPEPRILHKDKGIQVITPVFYTLESRIFFTLDLHYSIIISLKDALPQFNRTYDASIIIQLAMPQE